MLIQPHLVSRNKDTLGGVTVFFGTRVPARSLLDYLQRGHTMDDFLDDFPTVTRTQAEELLSSLQAQLASSA